MLIHCDQCHSKYKITIKKIPSKPVNFRCGKCQKTIMISAEELQKELGFSPAPPAETAAPSPQVPSPEPTPAPPPEPAPAPSSEPAEAEGSQTDTVQLTCLKCGASFVKHKDDKARLCYQCRIDSIVTKIKDKYGVTQEVELPEAKSKYTFRSPDGLILGPIKLKTAAVLVREKRLQGREEVSKDGGEFQPLVEFEELRKFFPDLPAPAAAEIPAAEHEEEIPLDFEETPPPSALGARVPPPAQPPSPSPEPAPMKPIDPAPAPPAKPSPPPENVSRYKIRYPDGLVLGPIRLIAVEDLVAAGNLTGQEEVQKDNGSWKPFLDYPELKSLLASGEEIGEDEIVELTDLLEEVS